MTERESQYPFEKIWIDVRKILTCLTVLHIGIYHSKSINTALHGEPSAPDKFSGEAFKK